MEDIINIISNVGFPIACCIYLLLENGKLGDKIEELSLAINDLTNKLDKE